MWGSNQQTGFEQGPHSCRSEMMEPNSGSHSEKSEDGQALLHTPRPVTAIKQKLQQMTLNDSKKMKRPRHNAPFPTWAQMKNLSRQAEDTLLMTNSEVTPEKLLLAMMAVLTCASGVSGNYTYWAYIPNPPLLQVVDWTESVVFTNDSLHFPAHCQI
ncbi:endogenous retrovirus group K member 19 Env polyprotein-like [Oryx dammah]|uniref:endogenous retrovirus group K member 19 Env polyprotein-like n=1 Tax=Oryx dammah TaxID=59534 RepID=UPI001A9B4374|nr:endogenous retrovirus group K member 19 Env polyprotein-like [Oryx dammah]